MRNLIVLACTVLFVLLGACQQEPGLVDSVSPASQLLAEDAVQVHSETANSQMIGSDVATTAYALFEALQAVVGGYNLDELIDMNSPEDLQMLADQLVLQPPIDALAQQLADQLSQHANAGTLDAALDQLILTWSDFEPQVIGNQAQNFIECFNDLQIAQQEVLAAYSICAIGSGETIVGPIICAIGALWHTNINKAKFEQCVNDIDPLDGHN